MTDNLNVNSNLYEPDSTAEEFKMDSGEYVVPFCNEITVMKTEVKEELSNFEMCLDDVVFVGVKEEPSYSPEIVFKVENLGLTINTERLLNENLDIGNCENREIDLQNNKYRCQLRHSSLREELHLGSRCEQCFLLAEKQISESKDAGETYQCAHCTYSTPVRKLFLQHFRVHKKGTRRDNLTKDVLVYKSAKQKRYRCLLCKYDTHNKSNMKEHIRVHNNDRPFKCTYKNCKCTPENKGSCECSMCCFAATSKGNLVQHLSIKHNAGPKKYKCNKCKYDTHSKQQLKRHIRIHSDDRPKSFKCTYKNCECTPEKEGSCECNMCCFATTTKGNLMQHISIKHRAGPKKYKCNDCKYDTHSKSQLKRHICIYTDDKPKSIKCTYKNCKCTPEKEGSCECSTCCFTATSNDNLREHILIKHSARQKKHKCSDCKYNTYSKASLERHISVIHTDNKPKPFKCTYKNCKCTSGQEESCECGTCQYAATTHTCLRLHILNKHSTDSRVYKCSDCNYSTNYKANLQIHSLTHTGEKPFKCTYKNCKCTPEQEESCECDTCEYVTTTNNNLKIHISNKHSTDPKTYKCRDCNYCTNYKAYLLLHSRTHTGEKPFKCTYKNCKCTPGQVESCKCGTCGYASSSTHSLKYHILSKHSAESKKYKCGDCNYATHNKQCLMVHSRTHSGEKPFKCMYKNCICIPGQEEPCGCNMCEFATTKNCNLKRHIMKKHSPNPKQYMFRN